MGITQQCGETRSGNTADLSVTEEKAHAQSLNVIHQGGRDNWEQVSR